jgi:hypothetical protein
MCRAIQSVNGQDKDLSPFERGMVVGARSTGFSVSRFATMLGFTLNRFLYQEWSTTERTSSQLDTTVGSTDINMGQYPCGTLTTPCRVHAPMNSGCS